VDTALLVGRVVGAVVLGALVVVGPVLIVVGSFVVAVGGLVVVVGGLVVVVRGLVVVVGGLVVVVGMTVEAAPPGDATLISVHPENQKPAKSQSQKTVYLPAAKVEGTVT
jgi:hypothetical protein